MDGCMDGWMNESTNQPINQSINQSINQASKQASKQAINQWMKDAWIVRQQPELHRLLITRDEDCRGPAPQGSCLGYLKGPMTCKENVEKKLRTASWGAVAALAPLRWERLALNFGSLSKIRAALGRWVYHRNRSPKHGTGCGAGQDSDVHRTAADCGWLPARTSASLPAPLATQYSSPGIFPALLAVEAGGETT